MVDRFRILPLIVIAAMASVTTSPAAAQAGAIETGQGAPASQFYVLSFTDAPVAEVAEAVVGGALSRDLAIDPAVSGAMSFTAEGAFTSDALLQEFGTAALDQDLALMQSQSGDLALVPRANMAAEMADGSVLVALTPSGGTAPATTATVAPASPPVTYGQTRWWEGPVGGLLIFLIGAASGAGALFAGQHVLRPRGPVSPALIRITHTSTSAVEPTAASWPDDPELTIPRFETRSRDDHG